MRFRLSAKAKKYINSQDKDTRDRIYEALRDATKEPPLGDIEPITSKPGRYRVRTGGYRMLVSIIDGVMKVNKISPRGDAYKGGGTK